MDNCTCWPVWQHRVAFFQNLKFVSFNEITRANSFIHNLLLGVKIVLEEHCYILLLVARNILGTPSHGHDSVYTTKFDVARFCDTITSGVYSTDETKSCTSLLN